MATITERFNVVVSRKWKEPTINMVVRSGAEGGVEISMRLDEFVASLAEEMTHPLLIHTRNGIGDRLRVAAEAIVTEMKKQTASVM
jgi:hypothetical protein